MSESDFCIHVRMHEYSRYERGVILYPLGESKFVFACGCGSQNAARHSR